MHVTPVLKIHICGMPISVHCPPRYNAIFQFLLLLRRTQIRLQQSWVVLMQHYERVAELRGVSELRTHMAFLIDSLLYYVQVSFESVRVCSCCYEYLKIVIMWLGCYCDLIFSHLI